MRVLFLMLFLSGSPFIHAQSFLSRNEAQEDLQQMVKGVKEVHCK